MIRKMPRPAGLPRFHPSASACRKLTNYTAASCAPATIVWSLLSGDELWANSGILVKKKAKTTISWRRLFWPHVGRSSQISLALTP